jgi:hypothetical protein
MVTVSLFEGLNRTKHRQERVKGGGNPENPIPFENTMSFQIQKDVHLKERRRNE